MKRGCSNGMFNVNQMVYFTIIIDDTPYIVKYKIIEKIECAEGFGYVIDVEQEQEESALAELIRQGKVGANFRICGC